MYQKDIAHTKFSYWPHKIFNFDGVVIRVADLIKSCKMLVI